MIAYYRHSLNSNFKDGETIAFTKHASISTGRFVYHIVSLTSSLAVSIAITSFRFLLRSILSFFLFTAGSASLYCCRFRTDLHWPGTQPRDIVAVFYHRMMVFNVAQNDGHTATHSGIVVPSLVPSRIYKLPPSSRFNLSASHPGSAG